jgi:hypothetical protein
MSMKGGASAAKATLELVPPSRARHETANARKGRLYRPIFPPRISATKGFFLRESLTATALKRASRPIFFYLYRQY